MLRWYRLTSMAVVFVPFAWLHAAEIPKEGKIDVTWTYISTTTTMPSASGTEASVIDASLVLFANTPGSLLDRMVARCLLVGPNNSQTGEYKATGYCTYRDADGDMIFASDEEAASSMTEPGKGTGKILGGTGKYAGIAGEYTFTDEYIGNVRDNVFGGMGRKSGSYKISK